MLILKWNDWCIKFIRELWNFQVGRVFLMDSNYSNVTVEFVYMHICKTTSFAKKIKQRCKNGIKFVLILVYIKKNIEPCNENIF